ncbi:DNA repair helicase [Coemansia reversa NRRL 1564]|uniref:DNA 5'-3' helicase n=1 Tax=Coemansia reversa (strain ATCC 12441 / NRRL 1564) TaxID=763665 RepID=A0A2G5B2A8_COERN|nr:DNA repair helicase [Coemansia reversa NRRL 1564]|eukprot:PIA13149.1 DNA repair helicase [Coemansia reversa NRRL 1564]
MYYIGGVQVQFPFKPYPSQLGMMNHMIRALNKAQNTMIESPTGSGKSLALLCATLAWKRSHAMKQKQLLANISQIIRKFCKHNKSLIVARYAENWDSAGSAAVEAVGIDSVSGSDIKTKTENGSVDKSKAETVDKSTVVAADKLETSTADHKDSTPEACNAIQKLDGAEKPMTGTSAAFQISKKELVKSSSTPPATVLQERALISRTETVDYILDLAKSKTPDGLTDEDIAILTSYKEAGESVGHKPRIYFGTRTHKQVAQLVDELRRKTPYRLRTAVLGSRAQTCIHNRASKASKNGESVDDACRALLDEDRCAPFQSFRRLIGNKKLSAGGELEIWDLEDIVRLGKAQFACPYYAGREMAETAELVFCPYNYILDPGVREAAGIKLEDNVVILDEAHNIENAARDAGSFEITDQQLSLLAYDCSGMVDVRILIVEHRLVMVLAETLQNWLQGEEIEYEYRDYETQTSVWPKPNVSVDDLLRSLALSSEVIHRLEAAYKAIEAHIKEVRTQKERLNSTPHISSASQRLIEGLLRVLRHVGSDTRFSRDYRIAAIRYPNPELRDTHKRKRHSAVVQPFINTMCFWTMNSGVVFAEIASKARSIVLTSGTLSPLESYASELQIDFGSTLEANHVIDPKRFFAMSVECGPSGTPLEAKYKTTNLLQFQDDMGVAVAEIASKCPDGMLVFAPSYALLGKLSARWEATGHLAAIQEHKEVFFEPQGGSKDDFNDLLNRYRKHLQRDNDVGKPAQRGAVFFAVYRGKASEGIDFTDYYCRTVVNIGIPYPAFKDVKVVLKREYNDSRSYTTAVDGGALQSSPKQQPLLNGSKWYDIQAFRAINQALGRCLRHKNDWGAIIMLESRFTYPWNIARLSKWVRGHMLIYKSFNDAKHDLNAFYDFRIKEDFVSEEATEDNASVVDLTLN